MDDDGECDYMSSEFLASETNDIRPGLVHNRAKLREYEMKKQKAQANEKSKKKHVPLNVLQSKTLTEGLEKEIGPENKGFAMLQKMGFKTGSSLGASGTSGITKPIGITMKNDRQGLGRSEALKEIQKRKMAFKTKVKKEVDFNHYRATLSSKYRERDVKSDLNKSQRACYDLDTENGIDLPAERWFWPEHYSRTTDEEDSEEEVEESEEFDVEEKLELLTLYLMQSYCYCIWCGVRYDDERDLKEACPGPDRDSH